jgi:hypothetical protein
LMAAISVVKPVFHPRYAIPAEPGLLLLFGGMLAYLWRVAASPPAPLHPRWRGAGGEAALVLAALLLICAGYGLYRLQTDSAFARDDYRSAIDYVEHHQQPGDTIIHNAIPPFWYYDHGPAPAAYFPSRPYGEANVVDELNQVTRDKARLWYVANLAIPNDPDGFVDNQLRLHATRVDERYYGFLRVQLWQIPRANTFSQSTFVPTAWNLANELALTGYAVSGEPVGGTTLDVEVQVTARRAPSADDGFWVGLADSSGRLWGRADDRPHDPAFRLSSGWTPGESLVIRFDLPVALGTPPGTYQLVSGAYRLRDLAGLDVLDAAQHPIGQSTSLGPVSVKLVTMNGTDPSLHDVRSEAVAPGLVLAGVDPGPATLAPGDHLPITFLWRAAGAVADESASLRLRAASGQVIAQDDGPLGGAFPPSQWPMGALVREQRSLLVPASAPAGPAQLVLTLAGGQTVAVGSATINQVSREFRAPQAVHPLDARLGAGVALVGYDLSGEALKPGSQLTLTLDWHAIQASTISYHVFVHLLDAQDHIWAQWDGVPRNWSYPVSAWLPGEYVVDRYPLQLSSETPVGNLTIEAGMYDAANGQRLPVVVRPGAPTTDRVILQEVRVTSP